MFWEFVAIAVALIVSGLVSGTEAALIAVNRFRIRHLADSGNVPARTVQKILTLPEDFFGTVLVINNIVNAFIALLVGSILARIIDDPLWSIVAGTGITSLIVIMFSEITPKSIANANSERWSLLVSSPLYWTMRGLKPLVWGFSVIPRNLRRLSTPDDAIGKPPLITADELRFMIDLGEEQGSVEAEQGAMLDNVFRFGEKELRDIMTPRPEIVGVTENTNLREFMEVYKKSQHTRIVIWDQEQSDVLGTVSTKDVMTSLATNQMNLDRSVTELMREPFFTPETKPLSELLITMREHGGKIAVAVDEFGTVVGVVTLTRLIEQIVGRIGEEGETPAKLYSQHGPDTVAVEGRLLLEEANEELNLGIPEGDYETVAGYFLSLEQRIPAVGDEITDGNLRIKVTAMNGNRIAWVNVTRLPTEPTTPDTR